MENKTYTVSDVARIMHMTERTIRNYLKDGILKGTRVGGQWRFSRDDLEDLIQNSTFRKKVKDNASQKAKDYIDRKVAILGDLTVCAVIDYKHEDQDYLDKLECQAGKIVSEYKGNVHLTAISENGIGRCTIIGTIECVTRVLEVFKTIEVKE